MDSLHERNRRQSFGSLPRLVAHSVRSRLRDGTWDPTGSPDTKDWLADKLVALDPHKAALCYQLCRAIGARRVVEAGTSYGVSTIYLASAVRDNLADLNDANPNANPEGGPEEAGGGLVIGTEHEPAKVTAALANLASAGVDAFVEIREGDLRKTLLELPDPIDFMLVDIWIPMALPALELVIPHLRSGALVVCDNVVMAHKRYADYLAFVRDPNGPFTSITLPGDGGLEISLKR